MSQFVLPAIAAAKAGKALFKGTGQGSEEIFGYNFPQLLVGLLVYFAFAVLADWYFKASIGVTNAIGFIASLIGIKVPQNTNANLATLFSDEGWNGVNFWKLVQLGAILVVMLEVYRYYEANKNGKLSYVTILTFSAIIGFLMLTTIPDLLQKIKESKILSSVAK